jgi:integrase
MVLAYAVSDGRLAVNPAAGVSLPRVQAADKRFLNHRQVAELAEACGEEYRLVVLFLAYTGLRWGEMAALQVHRVDFLRRRVLIAESVTRSLA